MRILIIGARSFAARGLAERLESRGHTVECAQGEAARSRLNVSGGAGGAAPRPLQGRFDAVVNFSIQRGAAELETLDAFLRECGAARLVQVSSMAVYRVFPVPETGYAAAKIAQDRFFLSRERSGSPYRVSFIRPGILYTPAKETRTGGLGVRILSRPFTLGLVLGGARTRITVARIEDFHAALVRLLEEPGSAGFQPATIDQSRARCPRSQVRLVGTATTKREFLRFLYGGVWLAVPECLARAAAALMPHRLQSRFLALFFRPAWGRNITHPGS